MISRRVLGALIAALSCSAPLVAEPDAPDSAIHLTRGQERQIGLKLWKNEAGGTNRLLTAWNKGEDFGSFGIGHFIWYPAGKRGPFTESFPGVIDALAAAGEIVPAWLQGRPPCPWPDRESFYADFDGPHLTELRALLKRTVDVQTRYAVRRLESALPQILKTAEPSQRQSLKERFDAIASAPNGVYALVDYVNFKGEGVSPTERYEGKGWGLLQALELAADAKPGQRSVEEFAKGADAALARRVANAPAGRRKFEESWLPAWRARLRTYLEPLAP